MDIWTILLGIGGAVLALALLYWFGQTCYAAGVVVGRKQKQIVIQKTESDGTVVETPLKRGRGRPKKT